MATYGELASIREQSGWAEFQNKVRVAAAIKAVAIFETTTPAPTQAAIDWATAAIRSPSVGGDSVLWYVIGANDTATLAQILSASDTAIQDNVNEAVGVIVAGGA